VTNNGCGPGEENIITPIDRSVTPTTRLLLSRRFPRLETVIYLLVFASAIAALFRVWLGPGLITAGDFPYVSTVSLKDGAPFPSLWDSSTGTGGYNIIGAPAFPVASVQGILAYLHMDWTVSERLLWIFPALALPCAATYALALMLFRRHLAALVSALAVVTNSYIYLLYEGGQFGVAVAYGSMPLVLWSFMRGQRCRTVGSYALTGVTMAFQAMYDLRSTYITAAILLLYGLFLCADNLAGRATLSVRRLWQVLGLSHIGVALGTLAILDAWWLLPALFVHAPSLPASYTAVAAVQSLSLVRLSNALSLFHPFWFANDVRVAPINPLFFTIPFLVFVPLLWRRRDNSVLFLTTLALISMFLVKGDNGPAGGGYDWLFVHMPGFFVFRDATKFYQPLALAYALLLGATVARTHLTITYARGVRRAVVSGAIGASFLILAAFPSYPILTGQAHGTFMTNPLPTDFARFNDFIDHQKSFSRVLWVPASPRFGSSSRLHPALDAAQVRTCCATADASKEPWWWLETPSASHLLQTLSVRYIVVPDDTRSADYIGKPWNTSWANTSPSSLLAALHALFPRMHELTIGRVHTLINAQIYPLLFTTVADRRADSSSSCNARPLCLSSARSTPHIAASASAVDPVAAYTGGGFWYNLPLRVVRPSYLHLQQTYDPNWLLYIEPDGKVTPWWATLLHHPLSARNHVVADGYANAWLLNRRGSYHAVLVYWPQWLMLLGLMITSVTLLACGTLFVIRHLPRTLSRPRHNVRASRSHVSSATHEDIVNV